MRRLYNAFARLPASRHVHTSVSAQLTNQRALRSIKGLSLAGAQPSGKEAHSSLLASRKSKERKRLMLKTFVRWLLPLMVLVLIAAYMVMMPMLRTHAAATPAQHAAPHITGPHGVTPNLHWHF